MGYDELFVFVLIIFMDNIIQTSTNPSYVGCFSIHRLFLPGAEVAPTQQCWDSCERRGDNSVASYAVLWCGCGEIMKPAQEGCTIKCRFIQHSPCHCTSDSTNYFKTAGDLAAEYVKNLPSPHQMNGFNCHSNPGSWKPIAMASQTDRAAACYTNVCKPNGRKYFAYMTNFQCGCLASQADVHEDNSVVPVNLGCKNKMLCREMPYSVCLCGNNLLDKHNYASADHLGPLFMSDFSQCYSLTHEKGYAKIEKLENELAISWGRFKTTDQCFADCRGFKKNFVSIFNGHDCSCPMTITQPRFSDAHCDSPCYDPAQDGCGSPYAASVYTTTPKAVTTTTTTTTRKPPTAPAAGAPAAVAPAADAPDTVDKVIVENEKDLVSTDDEAGIGVRPEAVMMLGGAAVGVMILAIVVICCLCKKGSDSKKDKKKKKKRKDKSKNMTPEEKEERRKRREERRERRRKREEAKAAKEDA